MVENSETGSLEAFDFRHIRENIPELKKLGHAVSFIPFDPPLDSSDIGPESWAKMVRTIVENYDKYDGFVILHGTDTMAFTASALSFMLENLNKPVILTGSQLPINMLRTDGKENLITAVEIAAAKVNGKPYLPPVILSCRSGRSISSASSRSRFFASTSSSTKRRAHRSVNTCRPSPKRSPNPRPPKNRHAPPMKSSAPLP